ncbi:diguanylate cyclase [Deinococcus sp. S9]|nr:diguanylate cyclase [Deinococcus sp. S9]
MTLSPDVLMTPRQRLLQLGWRPVWALWMISATLHLTIRDFPGLMHDLIFAGILFVGMLLEHWRRRWGVVFFYAALAPFTIWLARAGGPGWVFSPDLTGYLAALAIPTASVSIFFHFLGVLVFLLYALTIGALALPFAWSQLAELTWYVLLILGLGWLFAWLLQEADHTVQELHRSALLDPLTGLGNRRAFDLALEEAWTTRREALAVALLDLDGLKLINDTRGHAAGDELLRSFATVLRTRLQQDETAYRLGGDEYSVLCAPERLETVRRAIATAVTEVQEAGFLEMDASVGTAVGTEVDDPRALPQLADERLYTEKRRKRARRLRSTTLTACIEQ